MCHNVLGSLVDFCFSFWSELPPIQCWTQWFLLFDLCKLSENLRMQTGVVWYSATKKRLIMAQDCGWLAWTIVPMILYLHPFSFLVIKFSIIICCPLKSCVEKMIGHKAMLGIGNTFIYFLASLRDVSIYIYGANLWPKNRQIRGKAD